VEATIANNIAGRLDKMVSPYEVACGLTFYLFFENLAFEGGLRSFP